MMNIAENRDKLVNYLKEIRSETKKVVWPGKNYIVAATVIIFIIVFLVVLYVMFLDFSFSKFFKFFGRSGIR